MNNTGIEELASGTLSNVFNSLLATYEIYCQNLRTCHGNIKGENFFELHLKFE